MSSFVEVRQSMIGSEEVNSVNLRDVHSFLGVGDKYSDWANNRLLDFEIGSDYIVIRETPNNLKGGRPSINHIITLDTAKHICMIQRNDKGKNSVEFKVLTACFQDYGEKFTVTMYCYNREMKAFNNLKGGK